MSDHWHDNLRKRMDLHEENAPEGLWKDSEQHIDTFNPVHIVKARRKILVWSLSSVAVVAVALLLLVLFPFNNQSPLLPTNDLVVSKILDQTDVAESLEVESSVALKQSVSSQQQYKNVSVQIPAVENDNVQLNEINETDNKTITDNKIISDDPSKNEVLDSRVDKVQSKQDNPQPNDQLLALSTISKSPNQSKWQTNLSMSNVSSSSSETHTGFGTFAQHETVEDQYAFMSQYTRAETYTEIDHNLPIMVGLTLRYNLNQRLGVSSGLTYSLLTSKLRSESVNYFYDDRQTLHYLGVPLNINYKLWQNNNFSTYISAGGLVEKNIAGKLSSDYYIDNKLQSSTDEKITSKQLQWSINSAVGLEYRLSDNFGIYAEPGVAYYFKNNSEIETIYKEQPINFNLSLGLRINFNN